MVGVSEGERAFLGVRQAAAAVKTFRKEFGLALFLNADHTHSLEKAEDAARNGFDEIIIDRSELPIDENAKETRRALRSHQVDQPVDSGRRETWLYPGSAAYHAAKWAVGGFTEALAQEVSSFGVKGARSNPAECGRTGTLAQTKKHLTCSRNMNRP
jgi:NADP-dependent 3-hydroxy acid dehydrogenase YdfG